MYPPEVANRIANFLESILILGKDLLGQEVAYPLLEQITAILHAQNFYHFNGQPMKVC